ncbi:MAG: hypothetical protein ACRDHF_14835 [Tepidiformaceae bacterium]
MAGDVRPGDVRPGDVRLTQLARIFGIPGDSEEAAVRAAASASPERLAQALFQEAADSDDVFDAESGRAYFEARLEYLADFLPEGARPVVREAFEQKLTAWE